MLAVILPTQGVSAIGRPALINSVVQPSGQTVAIPERAVEVAPNVFSLGTAQDPSTGQVVDGYAFVTPKSEGARSGNTSGGRTSSSNCYAYISSGALWKTKEDWVVNPTNTVGLDTQYVFDTVQTGIHQWQDAADGKINGSLVSIFGTGTQTSTPLTLDTVAPDGQNEVLFGSIDGDSTIAVTYVWGLFGGSPKTREIIEWDMVFDQESFQWTQDGTTNPNAMDFANIATHELGHAFGLTHPDGSCADETMYAYANNGETKKITLNAGDIAGINKLY